jgi:hypothetical protein
LLRGEGGEKKVKWMDEEEEKKSSSGGPSALIRTAEKKKFQRLAELYRLP